MQLFRCVVDTPVGAGAGLQFTVKNTHDLSVVSRSAVLLGVLLLASAPAIPLVGTFFTDLTDHIKTLLSYLLERDDPHAFVMGALEMLNRARVAEGIPPVGLANLTAAQFRALYMARRDYLSHYDVEGRHPVYYYTALDGGLYAVEENGFMCSGCSIDGDLGKRMVELMVFEDDGSLWGHRDSLLDPCNNYAAIAVARNGSRIYAVVYMVARWVEWISPPSYSNGVFYAKGIAKLPPSGKLDDGRLYYKIFIYRAELAPGNYLRSSYSVGDLYAGVLPPGTRAFYPDIKTIYADIYSVEEIGGWWLFEVKFRFTPPDGALYTVVIFSKTTGVVWAPKAPWGAARLQHCKILTYTLR